MKREKVKNETLGLNALLRVNRPSIKLRKGDETNWKHKTAPLSLSQTFSTRNKQQTVEIYALCCIRRMKKDFYMRHCHSQKDVVLKVLEMPNSSSTRCKFKQGKRNIRGVVSLPASNASLQANRINKQINKQKNKKTSKHIKLLHIVPPLL